MWTSLPITHYATSLDIEVPVLDPPLWTVVPGPEKALSLSLSSKFDPRLSKLTLTSKFKFDAATVKEPECFCVCVLLLQDLLQSCHGSRCGGQCTLVALPFSSPSFFHTISLP